MRWRRWILAFVLVVPATSGAAGVVCSSLTMPPGALFLYPDVAATTSFSGNSFVIRGEDATLMGQPGPAPAVFGIAARNEANAQEARDSLSASQFDNVTGEGFLLTPPTASIGVVTDPDGARIDTFVNAVLAAPHVVITDAIVSSGVTMGDIANPQITYMTGQGAGVTINATSNVGGAGILIVEDAFTVQGVLNYAGLVIVRGPANPNGLMTVYGSLWARGANLQVGGACIIQYSREALALAVQVAGPACEPSACGDGTRTYDEACDDGNTLDGDCCSASCRLEAPGAACPDDGNVCTSERCDGAGTCTHAPVDGTCDDGDACTDGDTCAAGRCVGGAPVSCGACMQCDAARGCVGAPANGCLVSLVPAKSQLTLRRTDTPSQARLAWRWRSGQATLPADLESPGDDDWTFCLFGGPSGADLISRSVVSPIAACRQGPCWRSSTRGLRYDDSLRTTGIAQVKVLAGPDGKASVRVLGGGPALGLATLPVELPVTAQLRKGDERCWEARYPSSSVVQGPSGLRGRGGP